MDPKDAPDREARIGRALDFIEENLGRPFSLEEAASEAAWSLFHFHRVFQEIVGLPPGTYLRARRLSEAARDIAEGKGPLREIARARGFGSAEAFTRSFSLNFGANPRAYRGAIRASIGLGPFRPVRRPLLVGGKRPGPGLVSFEVGRLGPIRLAGRSRELSLAPGRFERESDHFWEAVGPELLRLAERGRGGVYGLGFSSSRDPGGGIRYALAVRLEEGREAPQGLEIFEIPGGEYGRALHEGPLDLLPESWLELYAYTLPRLGRSPRGTFDVHRAGAPGGRTGGIELFVPLLPLQT